MSLNFFPMAQAFRTCVRKFFRSSADPIAEPFPEVIEATSLELLTRQGELPFGHKRAADLTPKTLDPKLWGLNLQLYDLDGDGLSEIALARGNLVYWNKGRGTFKPEQLFARPLAALDTGVISTREPISARMAQANSNQVQLPALVRW